MRQYSRVNFHPSKDLVYDVSTLKYGDNDWYSLRVEVFAHEILHFRTHRIITDASKEKLKYES